jgi:hypothetical protein
VIATRAPTHAYEATHEAAMAAFGKSFIRYRYYVSSALLHGHAGRAGSVRRVPATEIEALVGRVVRDHLKGSTRSDDRDLISTELELAASSKTTSVPPSSRSLAPAVGLSLQELQTCRLRPAPD